ncbi:fimbrial protein [Acinetobacter dispersus]|uniref:fimbrial protein n=1 Tax=Acinetobacter dispersus TaxID=70348 RepID=UPI001F4AB96E|nr:hypothetical protein [Acinetobacter dispersus]MCH7389032.1 hypothetical protein [Acinetobacter dispersus]
MKIKHLALAFVALGVTNIAMADTGTINFTGQVIQDSCATALTGGASATAVTLATVNRNALATAGDTANETGFSLNVTGCEGADARGVHFTLTPASFDTTNNSLIANTGTATNVGVEIARGTVGTSTPYAFAGAAASSGNVAITGATAGTGSLPLTAKYKATGNATAGTVLAALGWTLVYD